MKRGSGKGRGDVEKGRGGMKKGSTDSRRERKSEWEKGEDIIIVIL